MQTFKRLLSIAAKSTIPVLIYGESGSGKEIAARFLHKQSERKEGPFVAVNCGALAKNLIENLLEGSKKGVYTGSLSDQKGLVRAADHGTLFLDEIGEMPIDLQSRLLRIIQEKAVLPIGESHSIPVDFRLICATHRDLKKQVQDGFFREDLFFRLHVFPMRIPSLRERKEDFRDLALEIWNEIKQSSLAPEYPDLELSLEELAILARFSWPGNVRQLKNVLQRYYLLKPYGESLQTILDQEVSSFSDVREIQKVRSNAPKWDHIMEALNKHGHNKSKAAAFLGVSRGCLCYQIKKHQVHCKSLEER